MTILLPRLSGPSADRIFDRIFPADTLQWQGFNSADLPDETCYASTGGSIIETTRLKSLRSDLEMLAKEHGFGSQTSRANQAQFDADMSAWLVQQEIFQTGEALRDDVWSFVGLVVAPDIVYWRFGRSKERFLGGIRNTFQRLWMRGRALDRGMENQDRWGLLNGLTEDALVQITERPSIGADPLLARELAEAWIRASLRYSRGPMEDIMRLATLRLRIRNEIASLSFLPTSEIRQFLDQLFDGAAEKLNFSSLDERASTPGNDTVIESNAPSENKSDQKPKRGWGFWRSTQT